MAPSQLHSDSVDVERLLTALGFNDVRRDGDELWMRCPFHREKSASWSIIDNPEGEANGVFHCFGCQEDGDAIDLVMRLHGSGYWTAVEWIIKHSLDRKRSPATTVNLVLDAKPSVSSFRLPPSVKVAPLADWATPPRRYLERRCVSAEQVERWGLGYASSGRLAGRIVFPIADGNGRVQSYNARTFIEDEKKYKQPHPDEGPKDGGIFGQRHWDLRAKTLVVTEGEFNALACEAAGFRTIAALSGSHLDNAQVAKMSRFRRILIATDPDKAGRKVARLLEFNYADACDVRVVDFPPGEDASSLLVDRGPQALRELLWPSLTS